MRAIPKKTTRDDPVRAKFLLLYMLKIKPMRLAELISTQSQKSAALPHADADMDIYRIRHVSNGLSGRHHP